MRSWKFGLFCLFGGLILAVHLAHWLMPIRLDIVPVEMKGGWIGTRAPMAHGYFRHTFWLPFVSHRAWLAIAADEYEVYVNGRKVAHNLHIIDSDTPFQESLSYISQDVDKGLVVGITRDSTLKARANEEWRMVHFHSIRDYLVQGRNTIAVYVQSDRRNRLAVEGSISMPGVELKIPTEASAWRARCEAGANRGLHWFDPVYDDVDWEEAVAQDPPDDSPLYAAADPEIWKEPFEPQPITGPVTSGEVIFRTELPADLRGQRGWVRVRANWPYDLFVGNAWVGGGTKSATVSAFDISQHLQNDPRQITIRLSRTDIAGSAGSAPPWVAVDGKIAGRPLASDHDWSYLTSFDPEWRSGSGQWQAVALHTLTRDPARIHFQPANPLDRRWFLLLGETTLILAVLLAALVKLLGKLHVPRDLRKPGQELRVGCRLLLPALTGILLEEVLRFRFASSDTILFFLAPDNSWLLMIGPVLLLLTLGLVHRPLGGEDLTGVCTNGSSERMHPRPWLFAIMLLGIALRIYAIDFQPPTADEDVSWDAARGILRTGVPETTSGIYYTRSPLYHYGLAGWLWLFGDNLASARYFTLVLGIAVIPALYALVLALSRRRGLALWAALLIAVDPWVLGGVNLVRFYQQMQFFSIVSMLYFLKGFVWKEGKKYQNLFFLGAICGVLSQEIFVAFFPAYLLAFLLFYRPFRWSHDVNVCLGFATLMVLSLLDIYTWAIVCLTPHVAVATSTAPQVQLHFTTVRQSISGFTMILFWMVEEVNLLYSLGFLAGLVYWIRRPDRALLAVYLTIFGSLLTLTVLIVPVTSRYCSALYPLLVAGAIVSADALLRELAARFSVLGSTILPVDRRWRMLMAGLLLLACFLNCEFNKLVSSYDRPRFMDHHAAAEFIDRNKKPGDKVMSVRPPAGAIILKGVDYYAMVNVHFDEIYMQRHGLTDRFAGGLLVWKLDQLRKVFLENDRIWIVMDERRWRALSGPLAAFFAHSCSVEYEFFGGQVLLWDRKAGRYHTSPSRGGEDDSF